MDAETMMTLVPREAIYKYKKMHTTQGYASYVNCIYLPSQCSHTATNCSLEKRHGPQPRTAFCQHVYVVAKARWVEPSLGNFQIMRTMGGAS